jgi:hypothetical protein
MYVPFSKVSLDHLQSYGLAYPYDLQDNVN